MDYDDNDFQSQSFQLASEENTKFPPGLRSYGLPKFDLDDNLQVHLRFDNLVETEVLLGIQSHEDNQWIEEFSRDGSAIEFSSGAAESCSIARHNNVWSEATSSESVEMLLKSVGQDEMITGHTNNEESGVCDGVGTLTWEMEPHLDDDGSMPSMLMDGLDVGHALPAEKCQESFSSIGEHSDSKLEVETTLQTDKGEKPETCNSRDMSPGMVGENWSLPVDEGNLLLDGRRCNEDANKKEDAYLVDGAVENKIQDNSTASEGLQVDLSATVMQNLTENVGELNAQESQEVTEGCNEVISYEFTEHVQNDNIKQVDELGVPSKEPLMDDCNCEKNKAEINANVVDSSSKLVLSVDSAMPVLDGCGVGECSEPPIQVSKRQTVVLSKDTEMSDKSVGDKHEASIVVLKREINFEGQTVEVSSSSVLTQSSTILKIDPLLHVSREEGSAQCSDRQKDLLKGDGCPLECGVSVSNSETTLLMNEDSELFNGQCDRSSNNHVGNPSSSMVELCSSTNILHEIQATENMKDIHDASRVHGDDHSANDPFSSSIQVESMQTCESSLVIEPSVVLNNQPNLSAIERDNTTKICECSLVSEPYDGDVLEKENVRIPANSDNVEIETNASSSQDKDVVVHLSASDRGVGDESASIGLVSEVTNLAFNKELDGVHDLAPGNGSVSDDVVEQKEAEQSAACIRDFTHLDKKEETITEMSREPGSFVMNECSQMTSEPVRTSELEQLAALDSAGELLPETLGQSPSSMETVSKGCQDEPQAVMGDKPALEYYKELEGCASISNGNDVAEVIGVPHEKCEGASLKFDGTMHSDAEMLTQSVPLPLEEFSHDISKEDQEGNKDNNDGQSILPSSEGDTINDPEISCKPASVSENSSEFCASEAGDSSPISDVPNCGSPTIISCNEPSRNDNVKWEGFKVSIDQNTCEGLDKEAGGGSSSHDPEVNNAEDDRSFTFKISCQPDLSDRETDGRWEPFGSVHPSDFVQAKEVSTPETSVLSQIDSKTTQENSHASPQASDRENVRGSSKGTAVHKTRSSNKVTDNRTAKGGRSPKEVPPVKQMKDKGGSPCNMPSSVEVISQAVQVEEMSPYSYVEGSARKAFSAAIVQQSSLPDLNSSASPSAMFQQPFTDIQQLQLRAQIFVYGSLIKGTTPDEACMISAFEESDGGRSRWENLWRASLERLHNQISPLSYPETPVHSHSGTRVHEQATRQSSLQSKAFGTPSGRAGSKATPSAVINPVIPLSSPLWSVTASSCDGLQSGSIPRVPLFDAHETLSPLHSYQSPNVRHFVGNTTPWFSQTPCPGAWFVSPQTSALDASAHFPALPITETGHVTSGRESSVPYHSTVQHSPSSSLVHSGVIASVPGGAVPLPEAKRTASPGKQACADPRPRKRKKSPVSEGPGRMSLVPQSQTETISAAVVTNPLPASFTVTTPSSSQSKTAAGNSVSTISPTPCINSQIIGPQDMEQRIIFSDESCNKVEQAKQQAEDSAALAATAVRQSQAIWNQLASKNNSGLVPDVEAKLAFAAAAAAAAASVARAAAAAAKIASDAALQAKLMADEALGLSRSGNPSQSTEVSPDGGKSLGMVSSASILKGKDRNNNSSSLIVAAKEASRRRVEAAAAAAKRAENLDAVVKAAELAAKAVSQAGAIVAMGDPIPLTVGQLVETGQDGFWKIHGPLEQQLVKLSSMNQGGKSNLDSVENLGISAVHFNEQFSNIQETYRTADQGKPGSPKKMSMQSIESHMGPVNGTFCDSVTSTEKNFGGQKNRKTSDVAKFIGVTESEVGSQTDTFTVHDEERGGHQPVQILNDNSIKEGSLVEVLSDEDALRRVWFAAKVLSLKDGKAYVCYTGLLSNRGSVQLKEWVPLEGEGDKAPRIRIARPMTTTKFEGTRKRSRGALVDHIWSVGDRVEAWTHDGWWEGIIMETRKGDETTFSVHFPAQGDTSIVRAWHLRPYLLWKDGQWVEWSHSTENSSHPHEGDTPQEKRPKLGRHGSDTDPVIEARGKVTMSKCTGTGVLVKHGDSGPLSLSEKEKVFTVGKTTKEGNNSVALRTKRTGLQMEGSRVIFGVPKPGKKRKFMEVSKHYVAGTGGQSSEGIESHKIAKYLMPQGSGRGWKNTSKVDPKGKRVAEAKPKMLKSGRTNKNLSGKDSFSTSVVSASNAGDVPMNAKATNSQDENISEKPSLPEFTSFNGTDNTTEGPTLFSSQAHASDAPVSKKKFSSAVEPTQWGGKGKNAPSSEKVIKNEEKDASHSNNLGKSIPDALEPRRSNRRIQPTSRLLEGLQSSLVVSKIPAVSHDKSTKSHHRSVASSKGNNHR